ncbi:signal peptidase I [Gordonia sp. HY002]|uniref:signal peptidase I n=1 Tax=Gordonia zhenghanii TaxID=2911516 RepID=UPI001EF15E88|nr:signal peptidase I [Gordonia zhenghanii]MCF8571407.1 signal peptidase I [Gordonia zhenghanii]MCF8606747.1 signal peptidase I [Gordonia zhenghanii]
MTEQRHVTADPGPGAGSSAAADATSRSAIHYLWQAVSWLLLAAAFAILFAAIVVPKIAGGQPYTVLTGSMRPDYPPGSLIVVKPQPADTLGVGDVITYQIRSGDPEVVTHRIIEVTSADDGEVRFITKGDANNVVDAPAVRAVQVRGRLWYSIPYLGYVNTWFSGNRRTIVVFVIAGALFAYGAWQFYTGFREDQNRDDETPDVDDTPTERLPVVAAASPTSTEEQEQ